MVLRAELATSEAEVTGWVDGWDELAVRSAQPFCSPHWMLAWWRHAAPAGASLRIVGVWAGPDLVAVGPFVATRDRLGLVRYRALGAAAALRAEPVARPGLETAAAAAMASALAADDRPPDLLTFDGISSRSPWPTALQRGWPGARPRLDRPRSMPAPVLELGADGYEGWLGRQSRNFRQQLGRRRRQLERDGAVFALASNPDQVASGLRALSELHHQRWADRGGSAVLTPPVEAMLADAGARLSGDGRFRLWTISLDGEPISSQLFVAAGGELSYWLGGFAADRAAQQPSLQAIVAAAEHAWAAGDRRLDLGGGGQPYKYRLATGEERLDWVTLVPRGRRSPLVQATLAPARGWRALLARLPDDVKDRVKAALGRSGGRRPGRPRRSPTPG